MKNLYIAIILSLLCAGCVALPIPIPTAERYSDRAAIKKESLEFIEVGSTKLEEVLLNLGHPDSGHYAEEVILEYDWTVKAGQWVVPWLVFVFPGVGGVLTGPISVWRYELRIEFDENGIVKSYEIYETEDVKAETEWREVF